MKVFSVDAPKLTLEKLREWEQTTTKDPTLPPPLRTESETWSYIWRAKSGSKRRFAESESKASEAESDPAGSRTITTAKKGSSDDKTIPLTDPQFSKMARENGILSMIGSREPSNIMDICAILETGRNSPTPGQTEFAAFRSDVEISGNEISVGVVVLSILKRCDLPYKRALNQPFTKFPSKVGFNDGLSVAKPDLVEGYFAPAFKPYDFERPVADSAIPTQCEYPIAMSHLTGDFKKLGGNFRCGQHQAAYNAAFLVYARDQAGIAVNGPDKVDAAFVGSFICDGERLQISVHYSSKDSSGKTVYHQTPVFDRNIRMNRASFTDGRKHLRNLQDWAQENANEIRLALIAHDMQSDSDALDESIVGGPRKVISPVSMDDKTVKK